MRTLFSRCRVVTVGALVVASVVGAAPGRSRGGHVAVSGMRLPAGAITTTGAMGTTLYALELVPDAPLQRCTLPVTFTVTATIDRQFAAQGPYRKIVDNPLTTTEYAAAFTPFGFHPELGVLWGGFQCAEPALPGRLRFDVGGQSTSMAITPNPCDGTAPESSFRALTPTFSSVGRAAGIAPTRDDAGYRTVDQLGDVTAKGDASAIVTTAPAAAPMVAIRTAPVGNGTWLVDVAGRVTVFGSAEFHGDLRSTQLNAPIVGMAATPSGHGYWFVAADGGVFAFGDARFGGSLGGVRLNAPIVGMAAGPHGGYWLVAADGGVFAFGDARFGGSLGGVRLNAPIVGMAAGPHGGYWLAASDGGVFAFAVPFEGSAGALPLNQPVTGIAATSTGTGYWLVAADNGIFGYGDARFFGTDLIRLG